MFRLFPLVICLFLPTALFAVGFGEAKLHSYLGEPLDIRVPLLFSDDENQRDYSVQLATPQEYRFLEQILPEAYLDLSVGIQQNHKGDPEVVVSSTKAIDETILVLVLSAKLGRGSFYKKIQMILDASPNVEKKSKTSRSEGEGETIHVSSSADVTYQAVKTTVEKSDESDAKEEGGWARRDRYGPVQAEDSLSEIAYRLRKDKRWSNQQIVWALYKKNESAFKNNDINQLKKGSFLIVPSDKEVAAYVKSKHFQPAKKKVLSGRKQDGVNTKDKTTEQQQPRYVGKVSLGLVAPPDGVRAIEAADKLNLLNEQAKASDLRMDGLDGKVGLIAADVSSLHKKIDGLALQAAQKDDDEFNSGWLSFMLLLFINLALLVWFMYHKQMGHWRERLMEAQQQNIHLQPDAEDETPEDLPIDAEASEMKQPQQTEVPEEDSGVQNAPDSEEEALQESVNYVAAFEDAVHQQDWVQADAYYKKIAQKDAEEPRTQALWIKKLHSEGDVCGRNNTLLQLYDTFDDNRWNRFCSFIELELWHQLQDENIISYTGKVIESEVARVNKAAKVQGTVFKPLLNVAAEHSNEEQSDLKNEVMTDFSDTVDLGLGLGNSEEELQGYDESLNTASPEEAAGSEDLSVSDDELLFESPVAEYSEAPTPEADTGEEEILSQEEVVAMGSVVTAVAAAPETDEGLEVDFSFDYSALEAIEPEEEVGREENSADELSTDELSAGPDVSDFSEDKKGD